MAFAALASIPCQFEGGTSLTVSMSLTDVLPSEGNATLYLSLNGSAVANYAATESGSTFTFTITAAQSAALAPGAYDYVIRFTYTAGEVVTAGDGRITVLPNLAGNQTPSNAQAMVTLLETVMQSFAATDKISVSFNGQSFTRANISDYQKQYVFWKAQLIAEQRAARIARGGTSGMNLAPRFVSAIGVNPFPGCRC